MNSERPLNNFRDYLQLPGTEHFPTTRPGDVERVVSQHEEYEVVEEGRRWRAGDGPR